MTARYKYVFLQECYDMNIEDYKPSFDIQHGGLLHDSVYEKVIYYIQSVHIISIPTHSIALAVYVELLRYQGQN